MSTFFYLYFYAKLHHMKSFTNILIISSLFALIISSCVPVRHYDEMKKKAALCNEERDTLKSTNKSLTEKNAELLSQVDELNKRISLLRTDTTATGKTLRKYIDQYDKINELNDELLKKLKLKNIEIDSESQKMLTELQKLKEELQIKEDELRKLEKELNVKMKNLEAMQADIQKKDKELELKNIRLTELESILSKKDSTVLALKEKVSKALTGFEGQGLTVETKNGKVYVSLDEKLLFKSGSWVVDPKGQNAIKELSKVLETNTDINILIEGHTDDLAYKGNGSVEDNWDLSAKRATAIVKIIIANSKIDPSRLMAAGRSEFQPIEKLKTPEARAKNRRTEIILTPKLDELFKMLENN